MVYAYSVTEHTHFTKMLFHLRPQQNYGLPSVNFHEIHKRFADLNTEFQPICE